MTSQTPDSTDAATEQSLYQRLGGYDAIATASDEVLARLMADPELRDYWKGTSADDHRRSRQLIVDFITDAAGGPAFYVGRDLKTAHSGMGINEHDWGLFMRHVGGTLDYLQVPDRERGEVLAFFMSLKSDVVES
jgi:hemoglobin